MAYKRTQEQLVIEAVRTKVEIPLQTGGVFEKVIYKVKGR